jgi:hypothetical protein
MGHFFMRRGTKIRIGLLLNELFRACGSFDVEKGSGDFYLWMTVHEGSLKGTLKPLLHEVQVLSPNRVVKNDFLLRISIG